MADMTGVRFWLMPFKIGLFLFSLLRGKKLSLRLEYDRKLPIQCLPYDKVYTGFSAAYTCLHRICMGFKPMYMTI